MTLPLTVVVPTHGRTDLFLETLASLERQTLPVFELVVTDDSAEWADRRLIQDATLSYHDRTGRPARYLFSEPRLGQARNTNQGLRHARGELVRILHSDDLLAPRALEAEVALMSDPRLNLDVLHHLVEPFRDRPCFDRQPALSLVQPSLLFRSVLHSSTPLPSALVFRRDVLERVGGMREDFDFLCDWEFCARLVIEQHRRHRFIGMLSPGYVGWRVHGDSTTGRLWHRHFLEHEQFMDELARDRPLVEALIGGEGHRDSFFASAVRYRYRRLFEDLGKMTGAQLLRSIPKVLRCLLSPASLGARLQWAPWTRIGQRRYVRLTLPSASPSASGPAATPRFVEPRKGWRFALSAHVAGAIIRWGKAYAAAAAGAPPETAHLPSTAGPELVHIPSQIEVRPGMDGPAPTPDRVVVMTEFNNTTNLWAIRGLVASGTDMRITALNSNAFVEPVLHQCLKLLAVGAQVDVALVDNQHLMAFGFKSLIEKLFPGQFAWVEQQRSSPVHNRLRYVRRSPGHDAYTAPHTGWTFGMLTTGKRLANVERFIDSIDLQCDEPHEILIVSPVALGALADRPNVRVIHFAEHDDLGWITRKKNLICEQARFSDILVCHDRFWLADDFTEACAAWGHSYGLAAPRVRLPDGTRALDWGVVSSQNHVLSAGGLLDYRAYSQYAYNPGGATVIRKAFWRDHPWNDNLFWNEHEDVELCRRVQRAGGIIALAAGSLIAAEDRWVRENPPIPFCDQNEVLYGHPVGEQRIRFLPREDRAA